MEKHFPFYMAYESGYYADVGGRMDTRWNEEWMGRRDYEYMKSAYPDTAKRMMPYIERECDKLEYRGSMMFDEYPDQLQLRLLCRRIYDRVKETEENTGEWLLDLIQVMTYHEIMKRRNEYRKYRRKYF